MTSQAEIDADCSRGCQRCFECQRWTCCDNMNPGKPAVPPVQTPASGERMCVGTYSGPITVRPDTNLFDIVMAADTLGMRCKVRLAASLHPDPLVRAEVQACVAAYHRGRRPPTVRWP